MRYASCTAGRWARSWNLKIVNSEPPMIAEIAARFPNRPPSVIYAFGDTIYTPSAQFIPPAIIAHEAKHGARQMDIGGTWVWWRMYLENDEFRYREELVAHAVEYQERFALNPDRNWAPKLLLMTADRLLAPFYEYPKGMKTQAEAMKDLKREIRHL
jgi:hypothetical protein